MRKVIAGLIALILMFALVSCGKSEEPTTTLPSSTSAPTTAPTTTTTPAYVLTTAQGNTVYWQETTRFEFDATTQGTATTGSQSASDYDIDFTVAPISKPDVNTSIVATSPSTTVIASDNTNYNEPTTSNMGADATPTTSSQDSQTVNSVELILNSDSTDSDNNVVLEIDASNWDGGLSACSVNVIISIDGTESGTTPTLKVPSKTNSLGYYDCTIDLSGLEVTSGTVVTYTIPAGTIKNPSGTQTNQSFSGVYTV